MIRKFIRTILSNFGAALFILALLAVLSFLVLSNGRVLDLRIAASKQNFSLLAFSALCWVILGIAAWRLIVGRWKTYRRVQSGVLLCILMIPSLTLIYTLAPVNAPLWVILSLVIPTVLGAGFVADRIVYRTTEAKDVQR